MKNQEKLQRIKQLTILLNKYRDEYYNQSRPSVSDKEYDRLFDELSALEKETDFCFCNSPTRTVGYAVNESLPKVKHDIPLLSLAKTKDFNEAKNFTGSHDALLMFKLDGLTICLTYENGELIEGSTRGNGEEGSLITDNVRTFKNIPSKIPFKGRIKITGEGLIHRNDFDEINKHLPREEQYKTPRNLAGGSVQQLDSGICAKREVYFYVFNVIDGLNCATLRERLETAYSFGFDVCPYVTLNKEENFPSLVGEMVQDAENRSIPIDGLVVMYDDIAYGTSLGRTGHHYKNGIALKFKEEEEETTILDVDWRVGRTGKITPVAKFRTVILDNTNVSEASLHNISTMKKLGIRKNATVTVVKKNEIIPQIVKSVGGDEEFEYPEHCPVCGEPTKLVDENQTTTLWCDNENCVAKNVRNLAYFASKDCMNIKGLSEKTLQKFVDANIIHSPWSIYWLWGKKDEILSMDGFGEKAFESLIEEIEKSRITAKLENFIAAMGIPNVALSKAKVISKYFDGDWIKFKEAVDNKFDFTELDGFGTEINKSIYDFFENKFEQNNYHLLARILKFVVSEKQQKTFDGMTFVITGTLNHYANRDELQALIESLGGKVSGSVSKKTTYLINNDIDSSSGKNKKAKELGIPIITEEDFNNLL